MEFFMALTDHEKVLLFNTLNNKRAFFEGKRPASAIEYSELITKLFNILKKRER